MESRSGPPREKDDSSSIPALGPHGAIPTAQSSRVDPSSSSVVSPAQAAPGLPPSRSSEGRRTAHTGDSDSQQPPPSRRGRRGWPTHWPFQSIATDTLSILTSPVPELFRRATWQPPRPFYDRGGAGDDDSEGGGGSRAGGDDGTAVSSPRDSTLIPDYVVNFIRGETPESVARRKRNGGNRGQRTVDITHQHKPKRSHMALMMRADEDDDGSGYRGDDKESKAGGGGVHGGRGSAAAYAHSHATHTSTTTDMRRMLPGGGAGGKALRGGWRRLTSGWRSGVLLNVLLILAIFTAGFICLVVAAVRRAALLGEMVFFTGNCSEASNINWGLHALINVAVVVLLVGANYVFQVLSSPTRSELSVAHESRQWLEIGVPSVRNLRYIGRGRAVLAIVLLAVAVVTQIIYNSVIFTTQTAMNYNLIAVKPSFVTGAQFSNASSSNGAGLSRTELLDLQDLAVGDELTNMTTTTCVSLLTGTFNSEFSNVLLVLATDQSSPSGGGNSLVATARAGIDNTTAVSALVSATEGGGPLLVDGSSVGYCLAQRAPLSASTCAVALDGFALAAVLGLNLAALALAAAVGLAAARRFEPLVTLGDAVASFLRDPDPSTRSNALVTRENLRSGLGGWGFTEGKYWAPPPRTPFWLSAASPAQWAAAGFWWLAAFLAAAGALALTTIANNNRLSRFGVASPHTAYLVGGDDGVIPAAALAVAASAPQVLLGGLYLSVNALLTAFFLSRESCLYAPSVPGGGGGRHGPRPLRVSAAAPAGQQTTSLYLTLPRPASWAMAVWFAAMGFVLSQACFAVSIMAASDEDDGSSSSPSSASGRLRGVGFSSTALLILLFMLVALLLAVAALAFLRLPASVMADGRAAGNPLALLGGSCSAVITARCHRVPDETDVWMNKVLWGVVAGAAGTEGGTAGVMHCTYSARTVGELDGSHRYV